MLATSHSAERGRALEAIYRPCVLAVFTNQGGQVLVAERVHPSSSWQFPQGGIDPGETPELAVQREMHEELGVKRVVIVGRTAGTIRYYFPAGLQTEIAKKYRGQDQVWFHLQLPTGEVPDLAKASDKEFQALAWVSPEEALRLVVDFKRGAYEQGLAALGILPKVADHRPQIG